MPSKYHETWCGQLLINRQIFVTESIGNLIAFCWTHVASIGKNDVELNINSINLMLGSNKILDKGES